MWANIGLARQTEWESPITTLKLNYFKRNTFPTTVMCITVKLNPWDSIGSYLEWGPSAHNGDANWAAKYGKKASVSNMCAEEKAQHVKYGYFAPVLFPLPLHLLLIPPATAFVVDYSFISNGAKKLMSNMDSPVTCSLHLQQSPPNHFRAMVRRMSDKMESEFAAILLFSSSHQIPTVRTSKTEGWRHII